MTVNTPYRSLEGPVFGDRVGIYYAESYEGLWQKHDDPAANYRFIVYRNPIGAEECGQEYGDGAADFVTLPRGVLRELQQTLGVEPSLTISSEGDSERKRNKKEPPVRNSSGGTFPMEMIPEEPVCDAEPSALDLPGERIDEDPNAEPVDSDEEESRVPLVDGWQPATAQLRDLKIAHDNAGHPSNQDFSRLIRRGNGKPEVAAWVRRHFKCEQCDAQRQPKARRPAAVPKTFRFNHVVGIDLVEIKDMRGEKEWWINCTCWGTCFQLVGIVSGKCRDATSVWASFVSTWVRIFGMPEVVVCDPGTEFQGYFAEQLAPTVLLSLYVTHERHGKMDGLNVQAKSGNGSSKLPDARRSL